VIPKGCKAWGSRDAGSARAKGRIGIIARHCVRQSDLKKRPGDSLNAGTRRLLQPERRLGCRIGDGYDRLAGASAAGSGAGRAAAERLAA